MEPGKRGTRAYFSVDDINAGAGAVKELGGHPRSSYPSPNMGWFATCKDPHGNEFGLWQNDESAPGAGPRRVSGSGWLRTTPAGGRAGSARGRRP